MNTKRITGILPQATLTQKLASMSEMDLATVARDLAQDTSKDALCTLVLETLEKRCKGFMMTGETFETFLVEIYS